MVVASIIQSTDIERGVDYNRIQRGSVYATPSGKRVHTTVRCPSAQDITKLHRYPIFEEDGRLFAMKSGLEEPVEMCDACPEVLDTDWMDKAACMGTTANMVSPHPETIDRLIATYCDNCPVVVPCGEYAHNDRDNTGIWGGEYIMTRQASNKKRKRNDIGGIQ